MSERKAFPLWWPDGWKRAKVRTKAAFGKTTAIEGGRSALKRLSVADSVQRLLGELRRMSVPDWNVIISTNVELRLDGMPRSDREPADPGVAVYWKQTPNSPTMRCMAIDRYTRVADNLAAVAATLEAMRAIERHGGAVSASFYCKTCEKFTQHRIDGHRKGPCLECIKRLDALHAQPKPEEKQERFLFAAPGVGAA